MVRVKSANVQKRSKPRGMRTEVCIGRKSFYVRMKLLRDIQHLQRTTELLIPKLPFARLVKEVVQNVSGRRDYKMQSAAILALQETAELYLVHLFEDACRASAHAKRITLMATDLQLLHILRARFEKM